MKSRSTQFLRLLSLCVLCGLLAACGSSSRKGGYYQDDGPGANPPANLDRVPDAVPRIEPLARGPNRPYRALGKSFTPDTSGRPYRVKGLASWYGKKYHGRPTSNGERYDMYAMTAAHPTLPIPSYVRVTRVSTGRTVVLRVNDRGPFIGGRVIDLSYVAAYKLGVLAPGSAEVIVERIMPEEIRGWRAQAPTAGPVAQAPAAAASAPLARPSPVSAPPSQAAAIPPVPGLFYLQAGAFSDAARAQSLASDLSGKIPADLGASVNIEQSAGNLYRVRIGPFTNREAAAQASDRLRNQADLATSIATP
jgi:rare lipoprotein A